MNTKDENLLVKLVKKSVGLPTANASCGCGTAGASGKAGCEGEATEAASTVCTCDATAEEEDQPTEIP